MENCLEDFNGLYLEVKNAAHTAANHNNNNTQTTHKPHNEETPTTRPDTHTRTRTRSGCHTTGQDHIERNTSHATRQELAHETELHVLHGQTLMCYISYIYIYGVVEWEHIANHRSIAIRNFIFIEDDTAQQKTKPEPGKTTHTQKHTQATTSNTTTQRTHTYTPTNKTTSNKQQVNSRNNKPTTAHGTEALSEHKTRTYKQHRTYNHTNNDTDEKKRN